MSSFTKNDIDKVFLSNFKEKFFQGEDIINFLGNKTIDKKKVQLMTKLHKFSLKIIYLMIF